MPKNLRHVIIVSSSTLGSRVLGLFRDIFIFSFLGASIYSSAFIVAFTIPNLFRRLLGEGALTSAFIPVVSDEMNTGDKGRAFQFLNKVLSQLFLLLLCITGLGMGISWGIRYWEGLPVRWYLVGELNLIMLPYLILICLAAITGACLNVLGRFAIPALSPVFLNLSMIFFLVVLGGWFSSSIAGFTLFLSMGVLVGGLIQFILPLRALRREGWRPAWDTGADAAMDRLKKLLIPGLAGAAVIQVNIVVVRVIAYSIDESGVALLYLASRLIEFPLGVFTLAVVTVIFPGMARMVSSGNEQGFAGSFREGFRLILAISMPAATGLIVLGFPIVDSMFRYGAFAVQDVAATVPLLVIYALGLPFYSLATFCVRGLHARKDMKSPLKIAIVTLVLNLALALSLIYPFGLKGLALANIFSTMIQTGLLLRELNRHSDVLKGHGNLPAIMKIAGGCMVMGLCCLLGRFAIGLLDVSVRMESLLSLLVLIPLGAGVYFVLLSLAGFEDLSRLVQLIKKRTHAASSEEGGT